MICQSPALLVISKETNWGFFKVDTNNWSNKRDSASLIVTNHSAQSLNTIPMI